MPFGYGLTREQRAEQENRFQAVLRSYRRYGVKSSALVAALHGFSNAHALCVFLHQPGRRDRWRKVKAEIVRANHNDKERRRKALRRAALLQGRAQVLVDELQQGRPAVSLTPAEVALLVRAGRLTKEQALALAQERALYTSRADWP